MQSHMKFRCRYAGCGCNAMQRSQGRVPTAAVLALLAALAIAEEPAHLDPCSTLVRLGTMYEKPAGGAGRGCEQVSELAAPYYTCRR